VADENEDIIEEEGSGTVLRSPIEILKEGSKHLRGTIKETLESDASHFSEDEYQLLKFHGVYQQDDRDMRIKARKEGRDKEWIMMIRAKVPGGVLTSDQYLAFEDMADRYGDGTLRVTTRQCFQLHHIGKKDLKATIRGINDSMITTLGACGDVERNVMACPAPIEASVAADLQRYAKELSDRTLPTTNGYYEIWLDHEKIVSTEQEKDPLYGELYMPRKFKSAITVEGDNCSDIYSNDIGIVAHLDAGKISGFTFLAGGGMGMTHTDKNTRPRVADPICWVPPEEMVDTFIAMLKVQRDNGNRISRRQARLKYLIANNGVARFKQAVESYVGHRLAEPRELHWENTVDHLGWHQQPDGRWFLGVWVENGRVKNEESLNQKAAFHEIVSQFRPGIRLTAQQNILFVDLEESQKEAVEAILRKHGVPMANDVPNALRYSMACPATPTCGLALAESERSLPPVVREIEATLSEVGLAEERLSIRMTGCPNGCARPFLGDIGFVGRTPGKYQIYVGGDFEGTHLNRLLADLVPVGQLADRLKPLFIMFREERQGKEGFGDFCQRIGTERLRAAAFPEPVAAVAPRR
jgi:sulfite reductase (ferredoxin)